MSQSSTPAEAKSILIVEDNTDLRDALAQTLKQVGFTVRLATNGTEGVAAVKQQLPDLILLDLLMPIMNGQDMMHQVEEVPGGVDIPVIILTNVEMGEIEIKQISRNQPTWYFVKSDWPLEEIVNKVKIILGLT